MWTSSYIEFIALIIVPLFTFDFIDRIDLMGFSSSLTVESVVLYESL